MGYMPMPKTEKPVSRKELAVLDAASGSGKRRSEKCPLHLAA